MKPIFRQSIGLLILLTFALGLGILTLAATLACETAWQHWRH